MYAHLPSHFLIMLVLMHVKLTCSCFPLNALAWVPLAIIQLTDHFFFCPKNMDNGMHISYLCFLGILPAMYTHDA